MTGDHNCYLCQMNIGFDAKRAFHNGTGLGHYSRTLLHSLAKYFPEHEYFLFNPKKNSAFNLLHDSFHEINPNSILHQVFSSAWRSSWVKKDLRKLGVQLYHGLSHEIPLGIRKTRIPSVVTMHDLIHERYPEQYKPVDVKIYSRKFRYACGQADRVIAISEQTKRDIIEFYKTDPRKIEVCYQSCNPAFGIEVPESEKQAIRHKYQLPERYFLYVGSIIERKNLLGICKALVNLPPKIHIPLVVIGDGKNYKQVVKKFIRENGLEERVIFLSDKTIEEDFRTAKDFPAIYQSATAMIYPSFYEGFGIPVLEALWSRLPVITSNVSCLPEAGGDAAYYVDPSKPAEIAQGMTKIFSDPAFAEEMKQKGWEHAQKFSPEKCAGAVMEVYKKLVKK